MTHKTAISPTRAEDYAEWYQQVVTAADLAEHAPDVRGCMVVKPWGYAIWELIQQKLDGMLKEMGHENAYFPLFIPLSLLQQEVEHVAGFAKECAVVTHHRLEQNAQGKLVPAGALEEPYVVRPTSEMIIGAMFAKWVSSYRDLPLRINQWGNVVRWEMRTRLFLRTTEFLWQEGHAVYATREQALAETKYVLSLYENLMRETLAIPAIPGEKSPGERFPGAEITYCVETMMQDGKALQAGTSHFLGQNFSKAQGIRFSDPDGKLQDAWTTSWCGATTRLLGALVMTHGDDDGMIVPPKVAPQHVVILPIIHKEEQRGEVMACCQRLAAELRALVWEGQAVRVRIDDRDMRSGDKKWAWVKKGAPLRLEVGSREAEGGGFVLQRRDLGPKESLRFSSADLGKGVLSQLTAMQQNLLDRATQFRDRNIHRIDTKKELYDFFASPQAGFASCHWSGDPAIEEQLKKDLSVTLRCTPIDAPEEEGICPISGGKSRKRVLFARAY